MSGEVRVVSCLICLCLYDHSLLHFSKMHAGLVEECMMFGEVTTVSHLSWLCHYYSFSPSFQSDMHASLATNDCYLKRSNAVKMQCLGTFATSLQWEYNYLSSYLRVSVVIALDQIQTYPSDVNMSSSICH